MVRGFGHLFWTICTLFLSSAPVLSEGMPFQSSQAQEIGVIVPPLVIAPQGLQLRLVACAALTDAPVRHYRVVLYLPDLDLLPAALRFYPADKQGLLKAIPESWRRWGEENLSPDQMAVAERVYTQLSPRDAVTIAYQPQEGSLILINDQVIERASDGGLIETILRNWVRPTKDGKYLLYGLDPGCQRD